MREKDIKWYHWIIALAPLIILSCSYFYMDTQSIIRWGIDVFKALFNGELGDYYDYIYKSYSEGLMVHFLDYEFLFCLTVGIWELPIAILEQVTGNYYGTAMFAVIYSKCFLILMAVACAYMVYRIAKELGITPQRAKWSAFFFLSSGLLYCFTGITGQYDVLGLFWVLLGVFFYIKGDMKWFAILFAISVHYKFLPLFVFFPLLILREKDFRKIILYLIPPVVTVFLFRIPFMNDEAYQFALDSNGGRLEKLFHIYTLNILGVDVPISFLVIGAVCIYCYMKKVSEDEIKYYAVWIPLVSMGLLLISFPSYPYWIEYIMPWFPILYFMNNEQRYNGLLAEMGMSLGFMVGSFKEYPWIFNPYSAKGMILDKIYAYDSIAIPITTTKVAEILGIDEYIGIVYGLFILCLITIMILYRPKHKVGAIDDNFEFSKLFYARYIVQTGVAFVPFMIYIGSIVKDIIRG